MNLGLYSRRLEVIGTEKNGGLWERHTRGEGALQAGAANSLTLGKQASLSIHFLYPFSLLSPDLLSLPRSSFLDVTQCGGALRDIQKTAARETKFPSFTPAVTLVIYATIGQNIC